MESDLVHLRALERVLEAAHKLRAVQRLTGLRVAENEVAIMCIQGTFVQLAQRDGDPLGIGTDRPEPADFGSPNSPRTYGETTRILRASKSTSRQRRPSNSPWRSPVIAAVR